MTTNRFRMIEEVREIIEQLGQRTTVPYVKQYVDIPPLAETRLTLLYFFLCETGVGEERARNLCVTTGLLQLALDTHERVRTHYEETLVAERNRQLTVLAGDYFSSYYYHLLAAAGEIAAIQVLADATQRINEAKMMLYVAEKEDKLSSDAYMKHRRVIDTALYTALVQHFAKDAESSQFWVSLIEETAAMENMLGEWEQLQWQQVPDGFTRLLLQKPGLTLAQALAGLETKALELLALCEQLVRRFHSAERLNILDWITSRYAHRVNRLKRVVEEM